MIHWKLLMMVTQPSKRLSGHFQVIWRAWEMRRFGNVSIWVLHDLSTENHKYVSYFAFLYSCQLQVVFSDRVITKNEKWILYHNVKQMCRWKACLILHPRKICMQIIIYYKLLNNNQTITTDIKAFKSNLEVGGGGYIYR